MELSSFAWERISALTSDNKKKTLDRVCREDKTDRLTVRLGLGTTAQFLRGVLDKCYVVNNHLFQRVSTGTVEEALPTLVRISR